MRSRKHWLWGAWTSAVVAAGLFVSAVEPTQARTRESADEQNSLLGNYLAGRFARTQHDTSAAADFYTQALTRDPQSEVLIEQAFLMEAAEGRWPAAVDLAGRLAERQGAHRMAQLVLGLHEFKEGNFAAADKHFQNASSGPIGELTSTLARAWVSLAAGDVDGALERLNTARQAEWAQFYIRYHRALIADLGKRPAVARQTFEQVFKADSRTPRTAMAYVQHAVNAGDRKLASDVLKQHLANSSGEGHPMVRELRDRVDDGSPVSLLIASPAEGLSEVFYGLGEALTGEGGVAIGGLYLQMSLYVRPDFPFALAALANVHESTKRHAEAIAVYERIEKGSSLQTSIDIRKAINLNMMERPDDAKLLLDGLIAKDPSDLRTLDAVGTILRGRKRYEEAVDYYTRAIALIPKPDKRHWAYWYARGTSYERLKRWPEAEADLQKALKLSPDQPLVLNYLGYSWIDQNKNLKRGMALIEKAVALKPDDGYIVDSLGWAHYRLGNYRQAVRFLERAVELKPEDPVLNDHLGDALWRVGRKREASYQWQQALTLNPEPEDAEKIKVKLQNGLINKPDSRETRKRSQKAAVAESARKKPVEAKAGSAQPN
ncbi:tetratricopeptide repeat protein [Leptospira interrogans]